MNGDGTFEYEFKIVEDSSADENYASSFGDYKIVVSEYFGDATTSFKVVQDPESFVDIRTPLGLKSDKSTYVLGSSLSLTGKVLDYHQTEIGNNMRNSVEITFKDSSGVTVDYVFDKNNASKDVAKGNTGAASKPIVFLAYPDSVGGYKVDVVLHPIQFDYGIYTANAVHPLSGTSEYLSLIHI